MIRPEAFFTYTLSNHPRCESIARIHTAAIDAVEPGVAVSRFLQREGDSLFVDQREYPLDKIGQIRVIGPGKACLAVAQPLADLLPLQVTRGLLIPKETPVPPHTDSTFRSADTPSPTRIVCVREKKPATLHVHYTRTTCFSASSLVAAPR